MIVFRGGLSLVRWGSVDRLMGYQPYAAFVKMDLTAVEACREVIVGPRRYCLMPVIFQATDRMAQQWKAPAADSFKQPTDIVLTEGSPENQLALEPLVALLARFDAEGPALEKIAVAMRENQAARAAWEAAHAGDPPQDTVIKFWTAGD